MKLTDTAYAGSETTRRLHESTLGIILLFSHVAAPCIQDLPVIPALLAVTITRLSVVAVEDSETLMGLVECSELYGKAGMCSIGDWNLQLQGFSKYSPFLQCSTSG